MTSNYHVPIINADPRKNDAAIWNDPLGTIDAELSDNSSELEEARGSYPSIGSRFDSLVLSGGNVATLADGVAPAGATIVIVDSAGGFLAGGRIGYTLAGGQIEYNTIQSVDSAVQLHLSGFIGTGGILNNTLITMISESEYQAAQAIYSGGTASVTLPYTVERLEREINVKSFGAFGNGVNHLVGSGAALTAARAAFPLTHTAFTITAADEYDWCAIQEAVLTAGQVTDVSIENVYIPVGNYLVNRTIVVPLVDGLGQSMTITGGGYRGVTAGANITATANISIFLIPGFTTISRLSLTGNDITNAASIGIRIGGKTGAGDPWSHDNCVHVTIDRVYFGAGFYRCISALYEVDQLKVTHCTSAGTLGQAVIYLSNDHATNGISPSAGVVIESCAFANNGSVTAGDALYGVYLMGTENAAIRNSVMRGYDNIIYLTAVTGVRNDGLTIEGIHSEINQPLKVGYLANRWTPNTAYTSGTFVRPSQAGANGWWYKCTTSGTSNNTTVAAGCASIRTTAYKWTASARGTGEFYLEAAAGGDPVIAHPFGLVAGGVPFTYNFAGNLQQSEWGYGNNDGLAFDTIYVRLSDDADPDTKATHFVWTTSNEPVWPTTYGGTVTDGTVGWTAFKQSHFLRVAGTDSGAINGGCRVSACYCENFNSFIFSEVGTASDILRIHVNGCTVRSADMIYNERAALRKAAIFENSLLEGCIRPFSTLGATSNQTSVLVRFCSRTKDYTGALGFATVRGVASWCTTEPAYNFDSDNFSRPNDVDSQIDPRYHSQVSASSGSGGTAIKVYVPYFPSSAFSSGLRGKTITITHVSGSDGLTVEFNSAQSLFYNNGTVTSLSLPRIGDSVTIRLGVLPSSAIRWNVVGSHGLVANSLTFVPFLTGSSGAPTTMTYTTQEGTAYQVGNMVFFSFNIVVNVITGGSGNIRIGGFPVTASAASQPMGTVYISGVDAPGTPIALVFNVLSSTTAGAPTAVQDNAAPAAWALSSVLTGDSIWAGGFYFV